MKEINTAGQDAFPGLTLIAETDEHVKSVMSYYYFFFKTQINISENRPQQSSIEYDKASEEIKVSEYKILYNIIAVGFLGDGC